MRKTEIKQRTKRVVASTLGVVPSAIRPGTNIYERTERPLRLYIRLSVALDTEFGVHTSVMALIKCKTVEDIINYMVRRFGAAPLTNNP